MEYSECSKCHSVFERPDHVPDNHPGYFCPVCRKIGYMALGIVHFLTDSQLNILPVEIMTA